MIIQLEADNGLFRLFAPFETSVDLEFVSRNSDLRKLRSARTNPASGSIYSTHRVFHWQDRKPNAPDGEEGGVTEASRNPVPLWGGRRASKPSRASNHGPRSDTLGLNREMNERRKTVRDTEEHWGGGENAGAPHLTWRIQRMAHRERKTQDDVQSNYSARGHHHRTGRTLRSSSKGATRSVHFGGIVEL